MLRRLPALFNYQKLKKFSIDFYLADIFKIRIAQYIELETQ